MAEYSVALLTSSPQHSDITDPDSHSLGGSAAIAIYPTEYLAMVVQLDAIRTSDGGGDYERTIGLSYGLRIAKKPGLLVPMAAAAVGGIHALVKDEPWNW